MDTMLSHRVMCLNVSRTYDSDYEDYTFCIFGTCVPKQWTNMLPSYSTLKLPATGCSETLVDIYKTTGLPPQKV